MLFLNTFSLLTFSVSMFGGTKHNVSGNEVQRHHLLPSVEKNDSVPGPWETMTIRRKTGDQDVLIKMENGEVTLLEIDGKVIDQSEYSQHQELIDQVKPGKSSSNPGGLFFQWGDQHSFGDLELNEDRLDSLFREYSGGRNSFGFSKGDNFEPWGGWMDLDSMMAQMSTWVKQWQEQWSTGESWQFDPDDSDSGPLSQAEAPENSAAAEGFDTILGNALNKDGLLIPGKQNTVELTYKHLKINGEKQPENIFQKYKRIFEAATGMPLQKKSQIKFSFAGKESSRKYRIY